MKFFIYKHNSVLEFAYFNAFIYNPIKMEVILLSWKPTRCPMPFIIVKNKTEFEQRFNKTKVSDEFLASCRKAGKLFGRVCSHANK